MPMGSSCYPCLISSLSFPCSYLISFGMELMFQVVLGDWVELRWQKEGGGKEGADAGRREFLLSTLVLIC